MNSTPTMKKYRKSSVSTRRIWALAESFDPRVYGCRINLEHLKSYSPDSTFRRYGDVSALKAETIADDSILNGKRALFAQISPTDDLVQMNKALQKIYTSMEISPNFANTGKAYLVGLAVTDVPGALYIARYALRYQLVPTDRFTRSTAYLIAEEVAESAGRAYATGKPIDIDHLLQTIELMEGEDMPDQVRAKLHKITGYVLRDSDRGELALNHLNRALQLNVKCGVKKDIERLAVKLKNAASR